jgi:alpha-L-fucosidase
LSHELGEGFRLGRDWVPPECDVSIRPGWFYRASEDAHVKSPEMLFRLYERSVGRNCTLLLNVPPDHRGLIAEPDVKALAGFRRLVESTYGRNLISGARATANLSRGPAFEAENVLDEDAGTYWAAPDAATEASLTVTLKQATRFNRVVLQEHIALGQRVGGFTVEALVDGSWRRIGYGTTIGYKRILAVPETTATAVRVSIHDARACPTLTEIGLFATSD